MRSIDSLRLSQAILFFKQAREAGVDGIANYGVDETTAAGLEQAVDSLQGGGWIF